MQTASFGLFFDLVNTTTFIFDVQHFFLCFSVFFAAQIRAINVIMDCLTAWAALSILPGRENTPNLFFWKTHSHKSSVGTDDVLPTAQWNVYIHFSF